MFYMNNGADQYTGSEHLSIYKRNKIIYSAFVKSKYVLCGAISRSRCQIFLSIK